jgi:hypothetical protein
MVGSLKATRILLWSLAIAALAGAYVLLTAKHSRLPPEMGPAACATPPPNINKLGNALAPQDVSAALGSYGREGATLMAAIRPGDTVHEFETGVTGGHLVMRGKCYIGQAVAWIR